MNGCELYPPNMPGSLLLSNDALSDRSDLSTRSLDSKIAGKKVSFNKAVRVKQYPWTPDVHDSQNGDHLTLPNSRFWFKVYKSRQDPQNASQWKQPEIPSTWEEDNMECIHDSLAPIAEDEDQDLHTEKQSQDTPSFYDRFGRRVNNEAPKFNPCVRVFNGGLRKENGINGHHPNEPPIDYFEERNHFKDRNATNGGYKASWEVPETNGERKSLFDKSIYRHEQESTDSWKRENEGTYPRKEWRDHNQRSPVTRDVSIENIKLPRMFIREDSPRKQIENRWNNAETLKPRERRSRSHDDALDNENNLRSFRKADKSVSTEDLNSNNEDNIDGSPYRLFRRNRDMATQCYGTLTKNKGSEPISGKISSPLFTRSTFSSSVRNGGINSGNDLKTTRSSLNPASIKSYSTPSTRFLNRSTYDQNGDKDRFTPKVNGRASSILSSSNGKNFSSNYRRAELPPSGKKVAASKPLAVNECTSNTYDYVHKPVGVVTKAGFPPRETRAPQPLNVEPLKGKENGRAQDLRTTATVGYVRGRQIPLNEANPNSIKKMSSRNDMNRYRNPIPLPKTGRGLTSLSGRTTNDKFNPVAPSDPASKYSSPNFESTRGRNFNLRNGLNSTKNDSSGFDDTQSMIDWSLSGFQLTTHPENRITSISDSECTVHRRPPLLMYIPGVSHHDRPAIEDDRLSALSDMSRSEINDDVSPLSGGYGMDRGVQGDIRRRHSMPRDGRLKWIKWKNNGQR